MGRLCNMCGEKQAVDKCRTLDGQHYWLCKDCIALWGLESVSLKSRLKRARFKILGAVIVVGVVVVCIVILRWWWLLTHPPPP